MRLGMTFFSLIIVMVSSAASPMASANQELDFKKPNCVEQLVATQQWHLDDMTVDCLAKDDTFIGGLPYLCTDDGADISLPYAKYLQHQENYFTAWDKNQAAQDAAAKKSALIAMRSASDAWRFSGFRAEISEILSMMSMAHSYCKKAR